MEREKERNQQSAAKVLPTAEHAAEAQIRLNVELITSVFRLGTRGVPQRLIVPVGRVIVLSYGHEFADASGYPEKYLAGEQIVYRRFRHSLPCWAIELRVFPGKVDIEMSQFLPAISRDERDLAHLQLSFYLRLSDPIQLLQRVGGKWEKEEDRVAFHQRIATDLRMWLASMLEKDLQVWSEDEGVLLERFFVGVNDYLARVGLQIDTAEESALSHAILFTRRYPSALYEIALQFAKAERALKQLLRQGADLSEVGFTEEDSHRIIASNEREGIALFRAVTQAFPEAREQVARWMERSGMPDAAHFIKNLYKKFPEREIKLSEQVLLSAIRNPWLTRGEWLKEMSESPVSRFQQIERRIRSLPVGS